ncbi:hypothetical protein Q5H93_06575 [Hymenobacter sp. ASUV-10]|uniref:DUF4138 domain-containing protein n=1 Tax=Hymenobacter aranciens TaxID=3063996 RepID=A0ABT9BCG3_9BACT|nr:hypothetical protein [Hymenobacter sp. ASUV-10]MDO7874391.1 hypothetical protein [Hymenobacter sp. ASUV-10]
MLQPAAEGGRLGSGAGEGGAAGTWQTQLRLNLRPVADSLVQRYGRTHVEAIDLPAPVEVRARTGRLQLRLFLSSLTRQEGGAEMNYSYTADGLLEIAP